MTGQQAACKKTHYRLLRLIPNLAAFMQFHLIYSTSTGSYWRKSFWGRLVFIPPFKLAFHIDQRFVELRAAVL